MDEMSLTQARSTIESIITLWARRNPLIYKEMMEMIEERREAQLNDFASSKNNSFRTALTLDDRLMQAIEKVFPGAFADKESINWFMKEFPQYSIPKKV